LLVRFSSEVVVFRPVLWWFGADPEVLGRFDVVVVSFRWSGGGGRRFWCCGGGLGGLAVVSFVGVVVVAGGLDVVAAPDL
jgi:hypothetical protein